VSNGEVRHNIIQFDEFELNFLYKQVRKNRHRIRLHRQPFEVLWLLASQPDHEVSRQEIRSDLWGEGGEAPSKSEAIRLVGTTKITDLAAFASTPELRTKRDHRITQCISEIRKALGDRKEHRYIATVDDGYVFIGKVKAAGVWAEEAARQLTETSPTVASISPDGKYLAFAKGKDLHLRIVDRLSSRLITSFSGCNVVHISWFSNSDSLLVTVVPNGPGKSQAWVVTISQGTRHNICSDLGEASPSVDGSQIAFSNSEGREIWTMNANGGNATLRFSADEGDRVSNLTWLPAGSALLFTRIRFLLFSFSVSIEFLDLTTQQPEPQNIFSHAGLRGICACASDDKIRVVYALAEVPPRRSDVNLAEFTLDVATGVPGESRHITRWQGRTLHSLSVTSDGRRVAFFIGPYHTDIYVGELGSTGSDLLRPMRITEGGSNNFPTAWTPDNRSVMFHSDRNEKWEIFKQSLDLRQKPRLVASGARDYRDARISPDGEWFLFLARQKDQMYTSAEPLIIMRAPLIGGEPQAIPGGQPPFTVRCARPPATICVLGERREKQLVFYAFDPLSGERTPLERVDHLYGETHWDLSPDGSQIAVALAGQSKSGRIRVLNLKDKSKSHDVVVEERAGFQSLDWAADQTGWYISSRSAYGADLLFINLDGRSQFVRRQLRSLETWGIPSPDGRYLAFSEWRWGGDVWMLENF